MAWSTPLGVAFLVALGQAAPSPDLTAHSLTLEVPEDISKADQQTLRERFENGITRSGLERQPAPAQADACADAECYRTEAASAGIGLFVGGTVEREGPDYAIVVYAIDGNTGETVASVDGVCEICGIDELGDMVGALAARLRPALENNTLPTVLIVDSDPNGAEVWVDGQNVGTTPLQTNVATGPHELEVIRRGRRTEHVDFVARPGIKESYSFRLARSTAIPPWLPWTALGTGVGSLGVGVGLLAIDEEPIERDCNPDAEGRCEFLHDTIDGGVVLTVVGIALVGTGVGLLLHQAQQDRIQRSGVQSRLRLVPGLGGASLVGRF